MESEGGVGVVTGLGKDGRWRAGEERKMGKVIFFLLYSLAFVNYGDLFYQNFTEQLSYGK
jgi:hypothetical protein